MNFLIPLPTTARLRGNVEKKRGIQHLSPQKFMEECTGLMFWNWSLGNTELILSKGSSVTSENYTANSW